MVKKLKCFISASDKSNILILKNILDEQGILTFDIFDFKLSISIQDNLKKKIRDSDFAIFIISGDNPNIFYEMGICEGLDKPQFIILDEYLKVPFVLNNKLFLKASLKDKEFLKLSIDKFIEEVTTDKKKKYIKRIKENTFEPDIKQEIKEIIKKIKSLRNSGTEIELEQTIEQIFKSLNIRHASNITHADKGIDFALWSDKLGRTIGNPILIEVKYGNLQENTFIEYQRQLLNYINRTEAKAALLLYLDKSGKRFKIDSSLYPLIMSFDVEDFLTELLNSNFENILLNQRNKIAHGAVN
jgi:hypothetical protein